MTIVPRSLSQEHFQFKRMRKTSHYFGSVVLEEFLRKHNLDLIVRDHEVVEDGCRFFGPETKAKMCCILFGAPS
jgi:hypothetical protein